jgi:hypothetical protein
VLVPGILSVKLPRQDVEALARCGGGCPAGFVSGGEARGHGKPAAMATRRTVDCHVSGQMLGCKAAKWRESVQDMTQMMRVATRTGGAGRRWG